MPGALEPRQKKLVAENFLGVSGPAGLPREVVARLHAAMKKSLADPKVAQRLAELGVQGKDLSPEEFTSFVAQVELPGSYEAIFRVADYHRRQKDVPLPSVPFLDVVTPRGYSCFRGGA